MAIFPKIDKIISNDDLRLSTNHCVIEDFKVKTTNGKILVEVDLRAYLDEETCEKMNGIALYYKDIKRLCMKKWVRLEVDNTENKITVFDKKGDSEVFYFKFTLDKTTGLYKSKDKDFKFPNFDAILPHKYEEKQNLDEVSFNLILLGYLCEAFKYSEEGIKLEFYGKTKGIVVKPLTSGSESDDYGMIMPIYNI